MSFNQFRSNVNNSSTTFRVGYIGDNLEYLFSFDKGLANSLLAFANALTSILAAFLFGFLQWLLHLHPGIGPRPETFLPRAFMFMASTHRGPWDFFVDTTILCFSIKDKRSLKWSIVPLTIIMSIICAGLPFSLNFLLASSNQGAYGIFNSDFSVAPYNWSVRAVNLISGAVEHIARGSDWDIFDPWSRNISLILGRLVEAEGSANDSGLTISKQAGCWYDNQFCLDGSIGNLKMEFRVDTSQIGVLSRKKVAVEGRSQCSQVEVDTVMAQTSQQYSNANETAIDSFQFGSLYQNGSTTPVSWSMFSALSNAHDTDSTTFWADTSGRPGNYSFPKGFNLVDAHLTLIFLPATILPSINGSQINSVFGEWPFRYGNITKAYNKPRLLACRDDARLCVGNNCTPFGGSEQVTPAAERLFRQAGIPRDFVFLATHAADGMVSGPVRLLRNKALMVNDFVAEGNTLDVSSYAIAEIIRWFALSAAATTALPGRIASGYFARKWVLSGVTGETTPPDSMNAASIIDRSAKELSRVTIGIDQHRQLVNIIPMLSISIVCLILVLVRILIFLAKYHGYKSPLIERITIIDPPDDLKPLKEQYNLASSELQHKDHDGLPTLDQQQAGANTEMESLPR